MLDNLKLSLGYIIKCLSSNLFKFTGRACRYEFFSYFFFYLFASLILRNIALNLQTIQALIYAIVVLMIFLSLALISALVRRLHDNNISGLILLFMPALIALFILFTKNKELFSLELYELTYQAFSIVAVLFYVIIIALSAKRGTQGTNKYGSDPLKDHVEYLRPL